MINQTSLRIFIGTSLSVLTSLSFAAKMNSTVNQPIFIPDLKPKFEFSISALYLQPHADNFGWSAVTTFLPVTTPQWEIETINPSYQASFMLGVRYIIPDFATDIQLNWTHLYSKDTDSVRVSNPFTQWVSPFSQTGTLPTNGNVTGVSELKTADAQLQFNYDVVNLDVGKFFPIGPNFQMRLFSGLSGVGIKEKLASHFQGTPQPTLSINNTSSFVGIGPRFGVNNIYHIYGGFNFVLQFAGSLLVGTMQPAEYQFVGTSTPLMNIGITTNHEKDASSSTTQIVSAIDAKIGFNYLYDISECSHLNFEVGYTGALYINPLSSYETNTNVIGLDSGSLSTSSVKHTQSNFAVAGPYLTVNWLF